MADQTQKPELFELNNGTMQVLVSNLGCTITSLSVPDKDGKLADVVLGFDSLDPYLKGLAPYFGCIVGRVANRIKDGKFKLNGEEYSLPINKPPNSLHGGHRGFDKKVWQVSEYKKGENPSITFKYHSADGEEGYPGAVSVTATYTLTSSTTMRLDMEAIPENKATIINLAQHTYWNLGGHSSGDVLNHSIQLWANHVTPVDENTVPTGEIKPVKGTPFDFTAEKKIGSSIHEVGMGYDHNYVLNCGDEKSGLKHVAKVKEPSSARVLNLWTNVPGVQFYTGNYVNGVVGKGGAVYGKHAGLCLETQGFPNAVNQPNFPSVVVQPAFLDYYDIPYKVVEVNPFSKKEIKWSDYKKVPILVVDGEQMVDSSAIIDQLSHKVLSDKKASSVSEDDEETKWRLWVDSHLVHVLSPNIYRNTSEALESFDYIASNGNFGFAEKITVKYAGAAAMYFVSKKLKKKYNITDERAALYEAAETWVDALGGRDFLGGSKPNLADLAVFGVLRPIRYLRSGKDMVENTRIGEWYTRMESTVGDTSRIRS